MEDLAKKIRSRKRNNNTKKKVNLSDDNNRLYL